MTVSADFAWLLHDLGLGVYRPDQTGGDIYLGTRPPSPYLCLAVARYPGGEASAKYGDDEPNVQVWVRGPAGDAVGAETRAQQVYDRLHGLPDTTVLRSGTPLVTCIGTMSGPVYLGADDHGCHEWSVNFRTELRRSTRNRR